MNELSIVRQDNFLDRLQADMGRVRRQYKRSVYIGLVLLVLIGIHVFAICAIVLTGWKKTKVRSVEIQKMSLLCFAGSHNTYSTRLDRVCVLFRAETTLW